MKTHDYKALWSKVWSSECCYLIKSLINTSGLTTQNILVYKIEKKAIYLIKKSSKFWGTQFFESNSLMHVMACEPKVESIDKLLKKVF